VVFLCGDLQRAMELKTLLTEKKLRRVCGVGRFAHLHGEWWCPFQRLVEGCPCGGGNLHRDVAVWMLECKRCGWLCGSHSSAVDWLDDWDGWLPGEEDEGCLRCHAPGRCLRFWSPKMDMEKAKRVEGCTLGWVFWLPWWGGVRMDKS